MFVDMCVCGSVTTITRNCVHHPHQTGSVGEGSDHLQLIKFWLSRAPGKGVCGGAKNFGFALLQPARSVCVSSERFFHLFINICINVLSANIPFQCFDC